MFIKTICKTFLIKSTLFVSILVYIFNFNTISVDTKEGHSNGSIIISEINYRGSVDANNCKSESVKTSRCAFDKWIELYNPNNHEINLSGWTLRFKNSLEINNNLIIPKNENNAIKPKSYFLISYFEKNFISTFTKTGIESDLTSGKIRNISNRENKTIQIELLNPNQKNVFKVDFNRSNLIEAEKGLNLNTSSYALEYDFNSSSPNVEDRFKIANQTYYGQNFGTPKAPNSPPTNQKAKTKPILTPQLKTSPLKVNTSTVAIKKPLKSTLQKIKINFPKYEKVSLEKAIKQREGFKIKERMTAYEQNYEKQALAKNLPLSVILGLKENFIKIKKMSPAQDRNLELLKLNLVALAGFACYSSYTKFSKEQKTDLLSRFQKITN